MHLFTFDHCFLETNKYFKCLIEGHRGLESQLRFKKLFWSPYPPHVQRAGIKGRKGGVVNDIQQPIAGCSSPERGPSALGWDWRGQLQGNSMRVAGGALEAGILVWCRVPPRPQRPDPAGQARPEVPRVVSPG
jgi:hypothetical protein